MAAYQLPLVQTIIDRLNEPRRFIQMLIGPRQTGKSTAINQAVSQLDIPCFSVMASIDSSSRDWLRAQWLQARAMITPDSPSVVLAIDEVQLIDQWSSVVKEMWDTDTKDGIDLRVLLSGSSSILLQKGLREGLTGRFEIIHCTHWGLAECRDAFGFDLDHFLFYGGYPGAAPLSNDTNRWLDYMNEAIIEPSISRDVIALDEVRKPTLMRRLFHLGAPYSGQELSYRKMLGQLDDAGNTTTLAHYLELLSSAGILCGLEKYDPKLIRKKASSPRLMVYDTSLMTATYGQYRDYLLTDPERRGHLVESAVGAFLLQQAAKQHFEVHWWREGDAEVDFVISSGEAVTAIEVKSGRVKSTKGLAAFVEQFPSARTLIVGSADCPLESFLLGEVPLF